MAEIPRPRALRANEGHCYREAIRAGFDSDPRAGQGADAAGDDNGGEGILRLPSLRAFVRHAGPPLLESTIVPGVLFYVVLVTAGFEGALVAALGWSVLALGHRLVRRRRVPAVLVLSVVLVALRTVVAYATGSAFLYFVQPTASTFLVALVFLGSALVRRPLIERLAHDFCPLDPEMFSRPFVRRFFLRLSLLWCVVLTTQAGFVMWLLLASSVRSFVVERSVVSAVLTLGGIALSTSWFVRVMREAGIVVRFSAGIDALVPSAVPAVPAEVPARPAA